MAMMLAKSTGTVGRRTRLAVLAAFSVVSALVIDLIAGPLIGAYSNEHFWPLFLCFALVSFAVSASATAIMGLGGRFGSLIVALLFIVIGGSSAGGAGVSLLPAFWQSVGTVLPPQNAVELFRNVIYFDGHAITTPIVVLALYALVGIGVVLYHAPAKRRATERRYPGLGIPCWRRRFQLRQADYCGSSDRNRRPADLSFRDQLHERGPQSRSERHADRSCRSVATGQCCGGGLLAFGKPVSGRSCRQGGDRQDRYLGRPWSRGRGRAS